MKANPSALAGDVSAILPVLEQLPIAVVVLGVDGRIQHWNEEAFRLFGWSPDEAVGKHWALLVPEEKRGEVAGVVERVLAGDVVTHVNTNRTKDGRWVVCEWRNAPLRDRRGKVVGVIAVAHSVLADGTTSYVLGQLLQHAPLGIALVAPDKRPIFVNRQVCDLLGYPEDVLAKMRFLDVTHPDDAPEDERLFEALLRGERDSYILRKRYIRADGQVVTVILNSAAVRDDNGQTLFVVRMLRNITEQVAAEEEARRRWRALEARNRILSGLLTTFDINERLNCALDETLSVLDAEVGGVYLREGTVVRLKVHRGLSPGFPAAFKEFSILQAPSWLHWHPAPPLAAGPPAELEREGVRAWFCLPLSLPTGEWLGALFVGSRRRETFQPDELEFLRGIALQLTVAVRGVWLYRQAQERLRGLESLERIHRAVVEGVDLETALQVVLAEVLALSGGNWAAVTLTDEAATRFVRCIGRRSDGTASTEPFFTLADSLFDQLIRQRRPLVLPGEHGLRVVEPSLAQAVGRYVALPMVAGERVVGALHLALPSSRPLTDGEMTWLQALAGQAALVADRLQVFEVSKVWADALRRFLDAQMQIAATPPHRVAPVILQTLQASLGVACAYFYTYDAPTETLRLQGCLLNNDLVSPLTDKAFAVVPMGEGVIGRVAQERRPLYIADTKAEGLGSELTPHDDAPVLSVYALPLTFGDRLFGVVALLGHEPHAFSGAQRALADSFAVYASAALQVAQLLEELRHQTARLSVLNQVAKATTQRLDIASIARVTMETLDALLPGTMRALFAYDPAADTFVLLEANALSEPSLRALGFERGNPIPTNAVPFADALRQRGGNLMGSVVFNDVAHSDLPFARQLLGEGCRALLIQTIHSGDELLGMLVKGRPEPFTDADRAFVNALCEHLAVAFHNARLFADLRRAYEELQRAQLTLAQQERLRALGQMASGIVHDVNNALVPILAFTEMLQEHSDPAVRQMAQQMQTAVEDLMHTINRLRAFYRPRSHQEELEPVDLNEAVRQAVDLTKPRWYDMPQREGITIDLRLALDETLPPIAGIGAEIREALTNLIFNAVDAIVAKGKSQGTIIVRTGRRDDWAVVEVADTGIGMDEATKQRALEPFFTTKGERGTGLGLAMVYGTMERHDGSVEIDSTLGVGTTVRLLFPLRVVTGKVPIAALEPVLPPLRLLVVDDDPTVRLSLTTMLQQGGHQVTAVGDGDTALALFGVALERGEPFDAVLTDLGMPHMSGTELLRRLKDRSPQTPVLVMTGWGAEAKPKGADAVLPKPVRLRQLKEALAHLLAQRAFSVRRVPSKRA